MEVVAGLIVGAILGFLTGSNKAKEEQQAKINILASANSSMAEMIEDSDKEVSLLKAEIEKLKIKPKRKTRAKKK